jgi:Domain of unknown function (DUF4388)
MSDARDDIVRIDADGVAKPIGETARVRMQGREGSFHVLPSPPHLVFLRQEAASALDSRAVLLSGEVHAPGVLCDVASFLGQTAKKGELVVIDSQANRSVYFDAGYVLAARSSVTPERLGQAMLKLGVLDQKQLAACREAAARNPLRLGEAAVQLGFVSRERLYELMAVQVQEIFHAMLLVGEGAFYFLDSFDERELAARHRLSVAALVRDGIRRIHETRFFRTRIPSPLHVPVPIGRPAPPEASLQRVFAAMDGKRSVEDLCRALGAGEFDVTRAVFQLVQGGHATIRTPRLGAKAAVGVYNDAVSLLLRELDAIDQGDVVREELAERAKDVPLGKLLDGAGPADDGRLDAERVAANVASRPDAQAVEEVLGNWLHEHASYAVFLARPHLKRAQEAAKLLEPIAPAADGAPKQGPAP